MDLRFFLAISAAILFCGGTFAAESSVPFMNLLVYRDQLFRARGQLPQATCAMDLRIRPALRDSVLNDGHDYGWFVDPSRYGAAENVLDADWAQAQRLGIESEESRILSILRNEGNPVFPWTDVSTRGALSQFGFYPGFYNLSYFASYQVGPVQMPWYKPDGFVYKVFFEFNDPQTVLTADRYKEFSNRLQAAGFKGDSKIPLQSGWGRFLWNNLIVHAPTIESALIAEQVGLEFFGSTLGSHSRGVDVMNQLTNGKDLDWPDFLCTVNPGLIPPKVLRYVSPSEYQPQP